MKTWRMMLVVLAGIALAAGAYAVTLKPITKVNKVVGGSYDPMGKAAGVIYPVITADSPGDSIDFTWYEYQSNGSMSRQIVLDHVDSRGLHVVYMKSPNSTFIPRNIAYQFNDRAGGGWTGELDANTARAGYTTLATLPDGRAVAAFHQVGGAGIRSVVAVDATRGAGAFTVHNVDTSSIPPAVAATPVWPHVGATGTYVHVAAHQNSISRIWRATSSNEGTSFTNWARLESQTDTSIENPISQDVIVGPSGKVAIAFTRWTGHGAGGPVDKQRNMDVIYIESTDNGATWGTPVNVTNYLAADTIRAFEDVSGVYDAGGNLNLAWTGCLCLTDNTYYMAAAIWHWRQGGTIHLASGTGNVPGTYWWTFDGGVYNFGQVLTKTSLSMDSTGNLFCVWEGQREMPEDSSAAGYENYDLYGAGSMDGGTTWIASFNITNSHAPGSLPGAGMSDNWPSLTDFSPDSVRMLWVVDRDPGSAIQGQGAIVSCPVHYLALPKSRFLVGVEGQPPMVKAPSQFELGMARPNPVGKLTEIQYALPVPRNVNLSVYNAAGQLVKVLDSGAKAPGYHGATWDGSSVPAGVYFYRLSAGEFTQTRSMVVVR